MSDEYTAAEGLQRNKEMYEEHGLDYRVDDVMRGPGDVARDVVEDSKNWFSEQADKLKTTFFGVNYDEEAQSAYENKDEIIHNFAEQYHARNLTPETMRNMEYLQDAGALDGSPDARISNSLFDMVKESPDMYGLEKTRTELYNDNQEAVPIYEKLGL